MVSLSNFENAMKMNCWRSIFLCFVAFSILFFALPAAAQNGTLVVKCTDSAGATAQGVKVVIAPLKAFNKTKDKKSDAQGVAEFTKLDEGAYRVFGRKEGFVPALLEFAMVKGAQETVTLKLEPGADKKLYFEDDLENQRAMALMKQGFDTYKQNKFPDAEKLFKESLAINPSNADVLYFLSISLLQQEKYEEGIATLDKTSDISSAWLTGPSPVASGPNPYEQIYQNIQQVKKRIPGIKGEKALQQKNFELATKEFTEAIEINPNDPELHASLALALGNSRRYDEAIAALDKAIQLKPGAYAELRSNLAARKEAAIVEKAQTIFSDGTKLLQDGDAAGALKKFEEAKAMVPPDRQAPIWSQMGKAQAKLNQPQAVESFKKSIELASEKNVQSYRTAFAQYYLDQKKFDEAVDVMTDPKAEGAEKGLLDMAKAWKDKEVRLAEAALERVLKINPENLDAAFDLGQLYYSDKSNDSRAKELLAKYKEKGKDPDRLQNIDGMLLLINRRNK
jgi:tetratricopeptide (TPR) repeat protein